MMVFAVIRSVRGLEVAGFWELLGIDNIVARAVQQRTAASINLEMTSTWLHHEKQMWGGEPWQENYTYECMKNQRQPRNSIWD